MDQYAEWDRFLEILEESRTYEQAIKRYRNERRAQRTAETLREKSKLERDDARDAMEEENIPPNM